MPMHDFPESDWRFLRSIQAEMLEELSSRINKEVASILASTGLSENEKRGRVYGAVHDRDRIVAECFDDWRRSRALERVLSLRKHGLLKPQHLASLTPETQAFAAALTGSNKGPP